MLTGKQYSLLYRQFGATNSSGEATMQFLYEICLCFLSIMDAVPGLKPQRKQEISIAVVVRCWLGLLSPE
jgi:hypothetical protein